MTRRGQSYVDCTELLGGYCDHDFEPYGVDPRVAARDYVELGLQPIGAAAPVKEYVVESMALANLAAVAHPPREGSQ